MWDHTIPVSGSGLTNAIEGTEAKASSIHTKPQPINLLVHLSQLGPHILSFHHLQCMLGESCFKQEVCVCD